MNENAKSVMAVCLDCKKPYEKFGLDIVLPHSQWLKINPEKDGLLCAQCIINRASKLKGIIVMHAIMEFA